MYNVIVVMLLFFSLTYLDKTLDANCHELPTDGPGKIPGL